MKITKKRLAPGQFAVIRDGIEIGRYGGRAGSKWAESQGKILTEDSPVSVGVLVSMIVNYAR
jgi:hypothetical protein